MKMLVIGIDGGDPEIINGLQLPFFRKLFSESHPENLTEDLWSRGWAETFTGKTAPWHGGAYERPLLDGTHSFTQSFGLSQLEGNRHVTPLWALLNQRGYRAGFMNLPGTGPAPDLNGFMVSGAGGGLGKVEGVPEQFCFPRAVKQQLEKHDYIFDMRFAHWANSSMDQIFDRLCAMLERRTEAFIALCRNYKVDFGYVAFMATSRMQNVAMIEIQSLIETRRLDQTGWESTLSDLQVHLMRLFSTLDDCVKHLMRELQPERYILVSDHGAAPFRYTANVNDLLERMGLFVPCKTRSFAKEMIRSMTPPLMRRMAKKVAPAAATSLGVRYNYRATRAFGNRYVPGIYLNDKRFSGVVVDRREQQKLLGEIVSAINASPEARTYDLSARLYRETFPDAPYADYLPDVWIDKPDDIFFEGTGLFVQKNPNYQRLPDLGPVTRDLFTGVKGRTPLFLCDRETAGCLAPDDARDLTLVYTLIDRAFSEGN